MTFTTIGRWIGPCAAVLLFLQGCASEGPGWGARVDFAPGWEQVSAAARRAAIDPRVWVPLAGAAALQAGDVDTRVSRWAQRKTPVFGSTRSAERWSDTLRAIPSVAEGATVLLLPSGDGPGEWLTYKMKGAAVDLAAVGATMTTAKVLKSVAGRARPNGTDDQSLPSGHAASAAINARLVQINLSEADAAPWLQRGSSIALGAAVAGTAWARVEAGEHYPSDTLLGIAAGNFFGAFVKSAFLASGDASDLALSPTHGGLVVRWTRHF